MKQSHTFFLQHPLPKYSHMPFDWPLKVSNSLCVSNGQGPQEA